MRNQDRFRGCLIGGAAGDALGYAVEFKGEQEIFSRYGDTQTQLKIAQLGNDAGIIGAALLGA